jgi:hypothetical protein
MEYFWNITKRILFDRYLHYDSVTALNKCWLLCSQHYSGFDAGTE